MKCYPKNYNFYILIFENLIEIVILIFENYNFSFEDLYNHFTVTMKLNKRKIPPLEETKNCYVSGSTEEP